MESNVLARKNMPEVEPIAPDAISSSLFRDWDDLFALSPAEIADFQLEGARARFGQHYDGIKAVRAQADSVGTTAIDRIEDMVPLLFHDAVYKSYPLSLIEKNRFDMMTKWMQGYTTIDLSGVDMQGVESIDGWLGELEAQTPMRVIHTSGTSGKLSFFPRSTVEIHLWGKAFNKSLDGFGDEPRIKVGGADGEHLITITPTPRYGRYIAQRNIAMMETDVAPSPDQLYTMTNGTLSADLVSLSGRIRVAQAKGELAQMQIPPAMRVAMRNYLEELERRPEESADFFKQITQTLKGKRVFVSATSNILYQAAVEGLERGFSHVFAPDSIGMTGGGGKGLVLPPNWLDVIREFTGIPNWTMNYAMSEMVGTMPMCPHGHYHVAPFHIPFLLDPESGAALPRTGLQTGRFAFFDLLPQTNWGGIISGDKVTMNFDGGCPCGRTGAYVHNDVERYSAAVTGEDKVTCAATVDNTDTALKQLLGIA